MKKFYIVPCKEIAMEIEKEEYIKFMCNKSNSYNCKNCPENRQFSDWGGNLPCGQQNCWVDVHTNDEEE